MKYYRSAALVLLCAFFLSGCTSSSYYYAYDRGDCKTTYFEDVDHNLDPVFQWKYDTLYMTWEPYASDDFSGYYIVRTEGDTCPYYYVNGEYYEYIAKKNQTYFRDEGIESDKTYYYRICVKETTKEIDCGSVKKVLVY